jgi:hypothetical protein
VAEEAEVKTAQVINFPPSGLLEPAKSPKCQQKNANIPQRVGRDYSEVR